MPAFAALDPVIRVFNPQIAAWSNDLLLVENYQGKRFSDIVVVVIQTSTSSLSSIVEAAGYIKDSTKHLIAVIDTYGENDKVEEWGTGATTEAARDAMNEMRQALYKDCDDAKKKDSAPGIDDAHRRSHLIECVFDTKDDPDVLKNVITETIAEWNKDPRFNIDGADAKLKNAVNTCEEPTLPVNPTLPVWFETAFEALKAALQDVKAGSKAGLTEQNLKSIDKDMKRYEAYSTTPAFSGVLSVE